MPENQTGAATSHDQSRQVATDPTQYTLTVEDALIRYEHAGHPRTVRSVQRYCAKGHLDCLRQETTYGDKFMITPESVARHIAQIAELASATRRDLSRQDATGRTPVDNNKGATTEGATEHDMTRQDATGRDKAQPVATPVAATPPADDRYVKQLERENDFLRDQIHRKDTQISEMTERARETNFLIKGLQDLVLRLQPGRPTKGSPDPATPRDQNSFDNQAA